MSASSYYTSQLFTRNPSYWVHVDADVRKKSNNAVLGNSLNTCIFSCKKVLAFASSSVNKRDSDVKKKQ